MLDDVEQGEYTSSARFITGIKIGCYDITVLDVTDFTMPFYFAISFQ